MMKRGMPLKERLALGSTITPGGCHEWAFGLHDTGYGKIKFEGKTLLAHRASYEVHKGEVPRGLHIDHLCMNRRCINPDHLEAVTPKENTARYLDYYARTKVEPTHCKSGHPYASAGTYKSGRHIICRACRLEKSNTYYRENRELVRQRQNASRSRGALQCS